MPAPATTELSSKTVQGAFRALADPTRRDILIHLSKRDMTIGEVASRFDMTRAAIKKHLTVLQEGDLIIVNASGRERINRLNPEGLKPAAEWLDYFDAFWDDRMHALKRAVEKEENRK